MSQSDRVLLIVTRIGVFLLPFVPLIIAPSMFFPFITGKGFTFRIIIEIIFACWLLLALRRPEFRPKRSLLLWSVTAFTVIAFLADIFAENPFKALWSNFERMEGFITVIHLGIYFLIASSALNSEKWWLRFFSTSVGVSAFLGIYGLLQLAGKIVINQGGARLDGTFGNAAYFAGYMLFHIFLTVFLIFRHRVPIFVKWLYGGALALQVVTLYYTATRGSAVGLFCGMVVTLVLFACGARKSPRVRLLAASGAALVLIVAGVLFAMRNNPSVRNNTVLSRYTSISLQSAGPRFMVWGMAWQGFKERPILGWGQEGFNYVFNKYYNPDMWTQEQWFDRTHDIFLDWLISAGALGLLAYLSLFGFLLWYLWRGKEEDGSESLSFAEKSVLTGLLVAYIAHNFFVFDNLISYILFFSLLAFLHQRYSTYFRRLEYQRMQSRQAFYIAGAILLILTACGIYFLNTRPILLSRYLIEGLKPQIGGVGENLAYYKKAFALQTIGTQELAEQAMQAALTVAVSPSVSPDAKQQFVSFAEEAMRREIKRAPDDARLRMFIGGFYNRLGKYGDALPQLQKAHELSPAKQTISFELADTYLNTGKQDEALALLKQAFDLAPAFQKARNAYVVGAIYSKHFALADALLASSTEPQSVLGDEKLVKAYYATKRYDKVIGLLELRLLSDPDNPQTHVLLAATYSASGNRAGAIQELLKAIALNPQFKQQGEYYINELKAGRNP